MRVVHLFRGYHDYLSGLLNSQAQHCDVHVIVARGDEGLVSQLNPSVTVHKTGLPATRSLTNALRLPGVAAQLRRIDPDVIHVQSGVIWEYGLAFGGRCPVVLTVHDIVNHPARGLMLDRTPEFVTTAAARRADAVIVHGHSLVPLASSRYVRTNRAMHVHSVDHGVIGRYGSGASRPIVPAGTGNVLFFGFLQRNKGLEYLVDAVEILRPKFPRLSVIVAGAASDPDYYQELLGNVSGLSLRLGHQSSEAVAELFGWADAIALPYIEASQSGVFQVATSFGVPAVATRVGGFCDVIRHRANGLLVPPQDADSLADAVDELLTDTDLRTRVISNLESDRAGRFSWDVIAGETLRVYRQAIDSVTRSSSVARRMQPDSEVGAPARIHDALATAAGRDADVTSGRR